MERYEKYKDSGIEWIDKIPEHWSRFRLGNTGQFLKGKGISKSDLTPKGIPVLLYGDIYTKYNISTSEFERRIPPSLKENSIEIKSGDLLFAASGETPEEIGKCICYNGEDEAFAGGDVIIYRQDQEDSQFFSYVFNSYKVNEQKAKRSKGQIVVHIYSSQLRDVFFPKPPLPEQTAIANYLDRKTAEIDALIAKKKRLLELYEEEKTAIINHAVTKGINPDAPMKDSGIQWLGEVPAHWEVKKLRYLCKITTGDKDTENRKDGAEYPFFVRSQKVERISSYSFDGEGILTAGDGVGVCKVWHHFIGKFDFHQRVYLMFDFEGINGSFLFHYMKQNFIHDVLKQSAKSTVDSLRRPMFLDFQVAYPVNEKEQASIVKYIEHNNYFTSRKISKYKEQIRLLLEYRTALISEVVTGKVKVTE